MDMPLPGLARPESLAFLPGRAFLTENPEAYGLVSDAVPVATEELMVAVCGHCTAGGATCPTFPLPTEGVSGLMTGLLDGLLPSDETTLHVLRRTFGEGDGGREHPVARYAAVVAQRRILELLQTEAHCESSAVAASAMTDTTALPASVSASLAPLATRMGVEVATTLRGLRHAMAEVSGVMEDAVFYTISFGACRVDKIAEGVYQADILAAGRYRLFLLDGEGMSPLWVTDTPVLDPITPVTLGYRRLTLEHPDPFALLLLSDHACTPDAAESRESREDPGMIWRHRMRLEDHILRILTASLGESEFGERAARFFAGHSRGRDSIAGAMLSVKGDRSYEVFRVACQNRLSALEEAMALLPHGYDPARAVVLPSRAEAEHRHILEFMSRESDLEHRVTEALQNTVLARLESLLGPVGERRPGVTAPFPASPVPADATASAADPIPTPPDLWEIYRTFCLYDVENHADYAAVAENRRLLRDTLVDHWVTLRPLLVSVCPAPAPQDAATAAAHQIACARTEDACRALGKRLGELLDARSQTLARVEALLTDGLAVLHAVGNDWITGRAGEDGLYFYAQALGKDLPLALDTLTACYRADATAYRALLTAYSEQRERLFALDTRPGYGFYSQPWQSLYDGHPDEALHLACRQALAQEPNTASYAALLDTLYRIAGGTGALLDRIEERGADRRTARDLAMRPEIRINAVRAAVWEGAEAPVWGKAVYSILTPTQRNDCRAAVRHHEELCRLTALRAEKYTTYRTMYERFAEPAFDTATTP